MGVLAGIEKPRRYRDSCQVRTVMEALDDDDKAILKGWIDATNEWSGAAIAKVISQQGFQLGRTAVNVHRRGDCSCWRI